MTDCIFCKIARHEIPAKVVYEDDDLIAFHDIAPAAPVHLLVIPKQHIESLAGVTEEHQALLGKMLVLAPKLAAEFGAGNGFKTLFNTGKDGGQVVFHLHMHIIGGPRPWSNAQLVG
ncbi:histidine triad nucleotide-binding protein [Derxia gummosa]|uniref:Histidine triad nucleotide-binding protein n=1 Tax=Derxia gummosa DSM 723 TaxID=1121388 RepID=A0A8B6X6X6_9BURK|nr:histidine triad nucleotide-binding protein [Derxia gummosa]